MSIATSTLQFYSTKHQSPKADLKQVIVQGLPADNGLFMPDQINALPPSFFKKISDLSFAQIAYEVAKCLLNRAIPDKALHKIVTDAVNFDAPLHSLNDNLHCLELFHGPSHAFKDFGARFMARIMSYFVQNESKEQDLYILVATSGDTGGAVAQGFLDAEGIKVIILYPSKKISELQEKQLTTLGSNITALEIDGTFDDCQRMVKAAFLDADLQKSMRLSSANSINLARLIPQTFYYFWAYAQLKDKSKPLVFSVPSGNFGNLTAGLIAKKMGLPVARFVAANNANNVFTEYIQHKNFNPRPSVTTYSNAMDVGNPSNFQRILDLYDHNWEAIRADIVAFSFSDAETLATIQAVYEKYGYVMCPHTAVAYLGMAAFCEEYGHDFQKVFLGTAHPAKFLDIVEPVLHTKVTIPPNIARLMEREKKAIFMDNQFDTLKAYLTSCQKM